MLDLGRQRSCTSTQILGRACERASARPETVTLTNSASKQRAAWSAAGLKLDPVMRLCPAGCVANARRARAPHLLLGFSEKTSLVSAIRLGLDMAHLYAANSRMSAHDEFILYDLRGWIVSFCTVSISSASSSWSNTWHLRGRGVQGQGHIPNPMPYACRSDQGCAYTCAHAEVRAAHLQHLCCILYMQAVTLSSHTRTQQCMQAHAGGRGRTGP